MGVLMSRDWQVVCLENTRAVSSNEQCVISFSTQNFSIQSAFASLDG
jgi:3-dehydroquinate synthase class II